MAARRRIGPQIGDWLRELRLLTNLRPVKGRSVPLVVVAVVLVITAVIAHTWLVANQLTSFGYERFSDLLVVAVVAVIGFFVIRTWRRDAGETFWPYLVLLHIMDLIAVTHLLRLVLGGLHCG